nr:hypothetical protein [uncultured Oscillibacter sp.]
MEHKRRFSPPATGGGSLLVVFAVLCLTIFALLSLATVRANQRLADASVKSITDYYTADLAAQTVLAQLRAGERPEGVTVSGDVYLYACPVSDTQNLEVAVLLAGEDYRILRWQTVPSQKWQADDSLDIWDGPMF